MPSLIHKVKTLLIFGRGKGRHVFVYMFGVLICQCGRQGPRQLGIREDMTRSIPVLRGGFLANMGNALSLSHV